MRFVPWYPLAEAARRAPATPGIFQVRVRAGLVNYPRGKSAMIHYGGGEDVRAAAVAFAATHVGPHRGPHPVDDWLCRHAVELSAWELDHPAAACELLVERFRARFGAPPRIP
jgi:hypothetical protein